MVNTKQVDVGYAFPPNLLDAVDKRQIRVLFSGDDVKAPANCTSRVNLASSDFLAKRAAVAKKFMEVIDCSIDWMYAHKDEAAKNVCRAEQSERKLAARDMDFYKNENLAFGPIKGMDKVIPHVVNAEFIDMPPIADQVKDMKDVMYTTPP